MRRCVFKSNYYNQIKHYLPGIIILVLGMVALYSSLVMIDTVKQADDYTYNLEQKGVWLYWSVISLGLLGFVLMVLNADKLNKLKKINHEKRDVLLTLEKRMSALEMARDGILIVDDNGKLSYINKSLCSINGIDIDDREKFIDQKWFDIFSDSDQELIKNDILPVLNNDGYWLGNFSMYREDGSVIYTEMSFTKLPDGGIVGTIQDVSDKKKSDNEKKDLEVQFFQAQKMEAIGRLAGGIAHDFNNILAAMNGYAEFLIEDLENDSAQHKFAVNILKAGEQARDLVDQMLAFSRRNDNYDDVFDLVLSVKETLSMLKATMPKTIEVNGNILVSDANINGNSTQIAQLIMNLCVNAHDAIEDKHGKIDIIIDVIEAKNIDISGALIDELPNTENAPLVKIEDMDDPAHTRLTLGHVINGQQYALLSVKDSGSGMSRIIMEHIFEPFFTTKSVDEGTGLGLATVHGIVISHNGMMVIDSVLGQGTKFDIYFPLSEEVKNNETINPEYEFVAVSPSNKHILIVDDEESVRSVIIEIINRLKYEVSFAISGLHGLDMVRENPDIYDLIITDYNMPEMTGLEMAQQINLDFPDMPFILLSGYSEDKMISIIDGEDAIKSVIRKPASRQVIGDAISKIL